MIQIKIPTKGIGFHHLIEAQGAVYFGTPVASLDHEQQTASIGEVLGRARDVARSNTSHRHLPGTRSSARTSRIDRLDIRQPTMHRLHRSVSA